MEEQTTQDDGLRVVIREDGIAILTMDLPGEAQNTLKPEFGSVFNAKLAELEANTAVQGMVFISGKPDTFLAGADIKMLETIQSASEGAALSKSAQEAFNRLSQLRFPVVAAIHGACLGGGLELVLACTSRICSDDKKTHMALPEVQLGLLPGAGGTQRLPRLVGIATALDMMLTGRKIRPAKAKKLGLVDDVVPQPILLQVAIAKARALAERATPPKKKRFGDFFSAKVVQDLVLEDNPMGRKVLFQQARKTLKGKTWGNYPAPERIIEAVELGQAKGFDLGLEMEARLFGELTVSPEAFQLINLFNGMTALKKDSGVSRKRVKVHPVHKIGVLGAGLMGAGVAYVSSALAGHQVRLRDRDDEAIVRGLGAVQKLYRGRVKRKALSKEEAAFQLSRVTGSVDYTGFQDVDVVIEAVFESLELKQQMIREIEGTCREDTIFASNTSSIPITQLAEGASRPELVIGMHYFSPVEKMPLLEIIVTKKTADWVTATCVALGKKQGKTVIVVNDGVGFYTSRILGPYMNEAARVLTEGVRIEFIDRALKQWGFPVGPVTLMDEVGIDVAAKVGPIMIEAFGERMEPPPIMTRLVDDGRFGRKNGKGFYTYGGKKKEVDETVYQVLGISPGKAMEPVQLAERCAMMMINEAALCYQEGILRSPRDGDLGSVFGLGFPPFRGGPFRYVDSLGAAKVVEKLEALAASQGPRFQPAQVLVDMARDGKKFYP